MQLTLQLQKALIFQFFEPNQKVMFLSKVLALDMISVLFTKLDDLLFKPFVITDQSIYARLFHLVNVNWLLVLDSN